MTPYKTQNLVYEWVDFSKFSQIWARIASNLRKFWKDRAILLKIWPKFRPIGIKDERVTPDREKLTRIWVMGPYFA